MKYECNGFIMRVFLVTPNACHHFLLKLKILQSFTSRVVSGRKLDLGW